MAGIITASVIGAGVGLYGASKAADAQTDAANTSANAQRYIFDRNTELNKPFYEQGLAALPYLRAFTGVEDYGGGGPLSAAEGGQRTRTMPVVPTKPTLPPKYLNYNDETGNPAINPEYLKYQSAVEKYNDDYSRYNQDLMAYNAAGGDQADSAPGAVRPVELPSYEETVSKPMESWDYEQSPAYKAKYALGMDELNKQLQARGLAASGVGANRAADLGRKLTASDYGTEREYRRASLADTYKNKYAENVDRYSRLLDQVKLATGASASMGQAGNQYAQGISESATAAGAAQAGFYAGIPNVVSGSVSTGLKAYDYGKQQGWWGNNSGFPEAGTGALPSRAQLVQYDSLYG